MAAHISTADLGPAAAVTTAVAITVEVAGAVIAADASSRLFDFPRPLMTWFLRLGGFFYFLSELCSGIISSVSSHGATSLSLGAR